MQQRRVRLGDILDDYCPRERRVTNHAVVAMVEDDVKQTRCTTCDAEHEYKHAKVPTPRRKAPPLAPPRVLANTSADPQPVADDNVQEVEETAIVAESAESAESVEAVEEAAEAGAPDAPGSDEVEDEWPVHRRLIRATLPRPEGQVPERRPPDFTIRQNGGRFDGQRNGNRARPTKQARRGQHGQGSGQSRFGNDHTGHQSRHSGNPPRHGNRPGQRGHGHGGGQKPGHGRGPKRGR